MTNAPAGPIVYVDANPFIYFIEGEEDVANQVQPFFQLFIERPGVAGTSELTLAEVLAKAQGDDRETYFHLLIDSELFQLYPVDRAVLIATADYRAPPGGMKTTIKLPDAIHVATAVRTQCQFFFSADQGLVVPEGLVLLKPDEAGFAELRRALA